MNHALKPPMHRRVRIFSRSLLALCAVTLAPLDLLAEENRVTFPELEALVHYTTVRRGNVTEHISTTPEAIEAIQKGQPIPDGTHFVLADYRDTEILSLIHISEPTRQAEISYAVFCLKKKN